MDFVYIGTLLCAVAFALVTIYIAKVLQKVSHTLKSLGNTVGEVETKLQYVTSDIEHAIKEADKTIDDVEHKLKATDSMFDTLENLGSSLVNLNEAAHHQTRKLSRDQDLVKVAPIAHCMQWSEVTFRLVTKWRSNQRKEGKI